MVRFHPEGTEGLGDLKAPGSTPFLTNTRRLALAALRLWAVALAGICVSVSVQTLSRELRAMGYRKLFARPRLYAQDEGITRRWARRGTRPSAPRDQPDGLDRYLRRRLPEGGQGRGPCAAFLQHRSDEPTYG